MVELEGPQGRMKIEFKGAGPAELVAPGLRMVAQRVFG
jgi:hypothetical protein